MDSAFVVDVPNAFPSRSSRPSGRAALAFVNALLATHERIALNFAFCPITPSFADELIGGLQSAFGEEEFRRRIALEALAEDAQELVHHVLRRRARKGAHPVEAA